MRTPLYGGATAIPPSFGDRVGQEPGAAVSYGAPGDAFNMSFESAFWVYNMVANIAYGERYKDVFPLIQSKIAEIQNQLFEAVEKVDKEASELYKTDPAKAIANITQFGVQTGEKLTKDWLEFWMCVQLVL